MTCQACLELDPFLGYVATGDCGESCTFGVSEIVTADHFAGPVCETFRATVLRVFGPGGSRSLVPRGTEAFIPWEIGPRGAPFEP